EPQPITATTAVAGTDSAVNVKTFPSSAADNGAEVESAANVPTIAIPATAENPATTEGISGIQSLGSSPAPLSATLGANNGRSDSEGTAVPVATPTVVPVKTAPAIATVADLTPRSVSDVAVPTSTAKATKGEGPDDGSPRSALSTASVRTFGKVGDGQSVA